MEPVKFFVSYGTWYNENKTKFLAIDKLVWKKWNIGISYHIYSDGSISSNSRLLLNAEDRL